jgi:hypothetical protein
VRVTPNCDTLSSFVISDEIRIQWAPDAVFNGQNYIVVWSDERFIDNYYHVVAARVTPSGLVLDTGTPIGVGGSLREYYPAIEFDGNRCLAVWYNYNSLPYGVFGRFINSSGQPEGSVITIASTVYYSTMNPKIAFDGVNYLVVYVDRPGSYYNVYGQVVDPRGNLVGGQITIAANNLSEYYADVVWDGNFYVVTWKEGSYNVRGQRVGADGSLVGSAFQISSTSANYRYYPRITASDNNYLVAWYEYRNAQYDIYGNVDQVIGVEEREVGKFDDFIIPTIISGPLTLPKDKACKIYDISGREVESIRLSPGVYFIEIEGQITKKVVKVR